MELNKIRNLSDEELAIEGRKTAEQLFRLRFQLTLGQTDVVKKVRILRKDVARIKTVVRERELGLRGTLKTRAEAEAEAAATTAETAAPKAVKKTAAKKAVSAKTAVKKTATKKAAAKPKTEKEAR